MILLTYFNHPQKETELNEASQNESIQAQYFISKYELITENEKCFEICVFMNIHDAYRILSKKPLERLDILKQMKINIYFTRSYTSN